MITFFVSGRPAPQGSKTFKGVRGGRGILIESSKDVGPWRERIALTAHSHAERLLDGPVTVRLDFVMPRPKSAPKRTTPPAVKRPDTDKLARACLDALTGICYVDDSQVTDLHATKRLAQLDETPGVHITVTNGSASHRPQEDQ
ncbi:MULTISPECIES: RusA family crossover junction endodeoxyribonuclease [unclassified Rhodococcus (in: high G+C Gram-positive bacteria)]|uniref:RusA family crossover junction endodeoxyribonuclease n=1 Tax=unclassified Rhodococcus (in: high G+C Gram-positive bacteria) TaxID=192944 RepID=UPI00092C2C9C|nr:RusA family crossover junction endodeoxyribonuclease [Rhodococcus sp. M8]OLL21236.1 hypothetical protein BKE56_015615 [Rhodococcus sp. M8]